MSLISFLEIKIEYAFQVKLLLSYGEHAREFFPIESMFHLLHNLTQGTVAPVNSHEHSFSRTILSQMDIFIVAMVNPDGRHYVETSGNYCWRGTSLGVDLNRNFDWNFGGKGSSTDAKDEEFRGQAAFSEPECNILLDITAKHKFDAFVSLHSGIRQIYLPFADTQSKKIHKLPDNMDSMLKVVKLMSTSTVHTFTYGLAYRLNEYTADGTIFDYMAGVKKIPFSLAIELWGIGDHKGAKCFDLFNPPNHALKTSVMEIHPIYEVLFLFLIAWKQEQASTTSTMSTTTTVVNTLINGPSTTLGCFLVLAIVLAILYRNGRRCKLRYGLKFYRHRRIISFNSIGRKMSMFNNYHI